MSSAKNQRRSSTIKFIATSTVAMLLFATSAEAGVHFSIEGNVPEGTGARLSQGLFNNGSFATEIDNQLNSLIDDNRSGLESQINDNLSGYNMKPFLKAMGNAATASGKMMNVDYASRPDILSLSAGLGLAFSSPDLSFGGFKLDTKKGIPAVGLSAMGALSLGLNLGIFGLEDFSVYGSYFAFGTNDLPSSLQDDKFSAQYRRFGLYGQYKLFREYSVLPFVLKWGGLDLITGFTRTSMKAQFQAELPGGEVEGGTSDVGGGNTVTTTMNWTGTAKLGADVTSYTIPIEAVTSVQILYVLTFFAGAGIDLNFGSSKAVLSSEAPIKTQMYANGNKDNKQDVADLTGKLTYKQNSAPTWGDARMLAGVQLNLFLLRIFLQANYDTTHTAAANVGVRLAF